MKLRILNYISAACFLLSSSALLWIPFLNIDTGLTTFAYSLAGFFWIMLLLGIALQILLRIKTRTMVARKSLKLPKKIVFILFIVSLIVLLLVMAFLRANEFALPITLFLFLLCMESFSVIRRLEKLV